VKKRIIELGSVHIPVGQECQQDVHDCVSKENIPELESIEVVGFGYSVHFE
jgi:hypothetical protein